MFGFGKREEQPSAEGTDVISILTADHRKVDALFAEFEAAERGQRKIALATQICRELVVHATAEEEIFYPQALAALEQEDSEKSDLLWEATVEHGTLSGLIDALAGMRADDDSFDAHVKVLKEYVKHHVKEEENEIFPAVRGTQLDLEALGQAVMERKQELEASMRRERSGGRGRSESGSRARGSSNAGRASAGGSQRASTRQGSGRGAQNGNGNGSGSRSRGGSRSTSSASGTSASSGSRRGGGSSGAARSGSGSGRGGARSGGSARR